MRYYHTDILLTTDIFPRTVTYWTRVFRPAAVEIIERITDLGAMDYVIATGAIDIREKDISDFSLLAKIIEIGYHFSGDDNPSVQNTCVGIEAILDFIKEHGFPFLAAELQDMPKYEQLRLASLDDDCFLNETNAWAPADGCSLSAFILSAKYLYRIWNTWCHTAFSSKGDDRDKNRELLQNYIQHGNWTVSVAGSPVTHRPQLVHLLHYDTNQKKYIDRYESSNLFCIITDQLYSFIADYERGKYLCLRECPICRRVIKVYGNQKYCAECAAEIKTQQSNERSKRYREKQKTATKPTPTP